MALIGDLAGLDAADVLAVRDFVVDTVAETYPQYDLRGGPFHRVLANLFAVELTGIALRNARKFESSSSLVTVEANPDTADEEFTDAVLANFNVVRQPAAAATGEITMVVSELAPISVANGAEFVAEGLKFFTTQAYSAKTSEAAVSADTDRVLTAIGVNRWAFSFTVVCQDESAAGNVKRGTRFTPAAALTTFVSAYAAGDFAGGETLESNASLVARLRRGAAIKAWSNRTSIAAMVFAEEQFATLLALSIVGIGDAEMKRDKHSLVPVAGGCRCDVYVKSTPFPLAVVRQLPATLVSKSGAEGTFQVSLTAVDAAAFYEVTRIAPLGSDPDYAGVKPTTVERSFALPADTEQTPDIVNVSEAYYSAYQTAVLTFTDSATNVVAAEVGDEFEYDITLLVPDRVVELQTFLGSRSHASPGADVLVRGAVPCFVTLDFTVYKPSSGSENPDVATLAADLAGIINARGFVGRIYAADLAESLLLDLAEGYSIGLIGMLGSIRGTDGVVRYIRSFEALVIPDLPDSGITDRTTVFHLDPGSVNIAIVVAAVREI